MKFVYSIEKICGNNKNKYDYDGHGWSNNKNQLKKF